ncbi:hypothetical protein [Cryptosporangium phraense]|uniref:Uncharacterized protein n=1 Tax=Cryptosporangium phraense TaxID=2593070 RepID=A0A545AZ36_9ACTN|nr:hypothetical protein [Cryptosporangium phraense]TQS45845.1 hypothetical protein FL583_04810 [Cryptosporangium phraense]
MIAGFGAGIGVALALTLLLLPLMIYGISAIALLFDRATIWTPPRYVLTLSSILTGVYGVYAVRSGAPGGFGWGLLAGVAAVATVRWLHRRRREVRGAPTFLR